MGMRPRRVKVHVNRKRTSEPDTQSSDKRPSFREILSRHSKRNPERQKTVDSCAESHCQKVRLGITVGCNLSPSDLFGPSESLYLPRANPSGSQGCARSKAIAQTRNIRHHRHAPMDC